MNDFLFSNQAFIWRWSNQDVSKSRIAVVGLGGVGSSAAESLARSGIGKLLLVDFDVVSPSNLNRQILALENNIGKYKTEVMKERILQINPVIQVEIFTGFCDQNSRASLFENVDLIIDAIDSLNPKVSLLEYAFHHKYQSFLFLAQLVVLTLQKLN